MPDAPSWLQDAKRDAPENAVALLAILSSAWLSRRLGYPDQQVSLFWLPTSLSLAWLMRRGPTALPGLAGGFVAWAVMIPTFPGSLGLAAGSVCGSLCAARALSAWCRRRPTASTVLQVARLLLVALLIQAPLAALLALSVHGYYASMLQQPERFLGAAMLIEGTSAVLFVPALLALLPARAGHACPLSSFLDTPGSDPHRIEATSIAAIVAVTSLCVLPPLIFTTGARLEVSLLLTLSLSLLSVAAMHGNAAIAGTIAMIAGIGLLAMRARYLPFPTDMRSRYELFQVLLWVAQGAALYYLVLATSLERRRQAVQLEFDATTDPVTGLANLRAFERKLTDGVTRTRGASLLVGEVMVNRYDEIELLAGRAAARQLSRTVGERLRDAAGPDAACVASLADDRFVLLVPHARAELSDASALAARLHARLDNQWLQIDEQRLLVRASIGALLVPADRPVELEPLLGALGMVARRALASPQRHAAMMLSDALVDDRRARLQDIESVRQAMHERRIELYAQPIVPAHPTRHGALHYEVLARLRDTDGSLLLPARFLPALAQGGLLREFDRLVIALAVEHLAADETLRGATGLCALNVTGTTLSDAGFAEHVENELARAGLPATVLGLEVTESESIADFEAAQANLRRLAEMGVSIAIDDFGTGLATFDYVKRLSAHWLKIDGSFVRKLAEDALDREIVRSIVRVAHLTGARTIAECVETPELAMQVTRMGVDALQGWGIARPMPIGQMASWQDRSTVSGFLPAA